MTKLFEYREYKNTEHPVPFCWKVLATLFTASVFLAMAVVCGSCRQDEIDAEVVVEEGQPATLRLEVVAEEQMDVATRAVVEDKISDLHVLVYNNKGELIGQKYQTGSSTVTVNTVIAAGCTVYAIANTGKADLFSGYAIHKEADFKNMAYTITSLADLTSGDDLPMIGSQSGVAIQASTMLAGKLTLTRMVAKVTLDIKTDLNSGITIKDYSLCNLPNKSYYVHRPLTTEAQKEDTENTVVVAGKDAASDITKDYFADSKISVSSTAASATFYMFENRKGVNANITKQDEKGGDNAPANATYVKINGTLNATPVSWKVYLGANNTTNFNIKRNRLYTCKITLKATGAADSRITFEPTSIVDLSKEGNANCYLASANEQWYSFDATVRGNGETQDYANEQYGSGISLFPSAIAGSTNAVEIPKAKVWDAVVVWETNIGVIDWVVWDRNSGCVKFKTGSTLGNAVLAVRDVSGKILWSWHIWRTDGVSLSDLNASNSKHTMTVTTNTNRAWYTTLMAKDNITNVGRTRKITMLRCSLGSKLNDECYYDEPAGNVGSYGVMYQFGRKDPFMAEKSYIDYAEKPIYGYGSSNTFNDVGFTVGDKIQLSSASRDAKATIDYTIAHPEVFIYSTNNDINNWIHNAALNTDDWKISRCLWGDNNLASPKVNDGGLDPDPWGTSKEKGKKTIYDPCPAGWRVAPADSWTGLADNSATSWLKAQDCIEKSAFNNGYVFYFGGISSGVKTLCPAIGRRMYNTGSLVDIAILGGFWWSSPSGTTSTSGTYFYSYSGNGQVHMASDHRPAMGYPIRCAKTED